MKFENFSLSVIIRLIRPIRGQQEAGSVKRKLNAYTVYLTLWPFEKTIFPAGESFSGQDTAFPVGTIAELLRNRLYRRGRGFTFANRQHPLENGFPDG